MMMSDKALFPLLPISAYPANKPLNLDSQELCFIVKQGLFQGETPVQEIPEVVF